MIIKLVFIIFQKFIDIISILVDILYSLLPNSPFTIIENSEFSSLISKINYFLPIYEFTSVMEAWLVAIAIFYIYSLFARWIKAVQ